MHERRNILFIVVSEAGYFANRKIKGLKNMQPYLRQAQVQQKGVVDIIFVH